MQSSGNPPLHHFLSSLRRILLSSLMSSLTHGAAGRMVTMRDLRWLITVSSTFQDVDFDGSLLPLFTTRWYNHGIKNLPNHS